MAQERIRKTKSSTSQKTEEVVEEEQSTGDRHDLKEYTDDLLDAIDEVLEENAEEFVRSYVQKGGE